ncbi:MAG TPA: tetratricopeptide repeat protein [Bryobacteraceae bacterium]|nr:tetratricopeptide repeat protein [Bryobacteraceae bacterium]
MLKLFFSALSIIAVLSAQPSPALSRPVELLVGKARSLEARGRLDLAAQSWQQLLLIEPEQQDAIAGLARIARLQGRNSEAEAYLARLRKANPASPGIREIEAMSAGTTRNPEIEAAARLAAAGRTEQAIAAYRKAFGGNTPPAEWVIPFNETLAGTPGGWEQATATLEESLRRNPAQQDVRLSLGKLYTYRPATRMKGISLLDSVVGRGAPQARQAWRQALVWEGGSSRSAESMRAYLTRYPDPELQTLAAKQQSSGSPASAGGQDVRRAYQAMKKEDLTAAQKQFEEALRKNPRETAALTGMGFLQMKQQDFAAALKSFEAASAISPSDKAAREGSKEARFWIAMQDASAALNSGRGGDASELFNKAMTQRPNNRDAATGYAGAMMQRGEYATAIPVLERLVKADATYLRGWKDLVIAKQHVSGPQAALAFIGTLPAPVVAKLSGDVEYLATLAAVQQKSGRSADARKSFARATAIAGKANQELPLHVDLQLASLSVDFDEAPQAVARYRNVLRRDSANLDAWEGFLMANNRAGTAMQALQTLETLPEIVHEPAQSRPGFLRAVATLEARVGNFASARSLMDKAYGIETADGKDASFYTQLQMAQLYLDEGKGKEAAQKFTDLAHAYPDNEEVWKGLIMGLQKSGAVDQASDAVRRMPKSAATALGEDPDYLAVVATVYQQTRSAEEAAQFLRDASSRLTATGRSLPPAMTLQLGWLLLDTPGSERELFALLRNAKTRTDYSVSDQKALADIWTAWLTRSADAANANGDLKHAVSILEAGIRLMPSEVRLQRALAANLLTAGDPKRATAIYQAAGLNGATTGDYMAAVGAAMSAEEKRLAQAWLQQGLTTYPKDLDLLSLAGKHAAAAGDFKRAEGFWRLALKQADAREKERLAESLRTGPDGIPDIRTGDPADDAGTVLLSRAGTAQVAASTSPSAKYRLPWDTTSTPRDGAIEAGNTESRRIASEIAATTQVSKALAVPATMAARTETTLTPVSTNPGVARTPSATKESLVRMLEAVQTPNAQSDLKRSLQQEVQAKAADATPTFNPKSSRIEDLLPSKSPVSLAALLEPKAIYSTGSAESDKIMDRIKAVEGRNSPYAGIGGNVVSRNGQAGFEKMMLQETTLESSTVMHGNLRATVVAKSVFADATGPDGQSLYRFGMLPQGDTFAAPGANGLAAEAQLSGSNFGLRFG